MEQEERDVLPPVMRTFQPSRDVHHYHPPPPAQHQEVRRTPSFVEKIREAEANPGVRFVRIVRNTLLILRPSGLAVNCGATRQIRR